MKFKLIACLGLAVCLTAAHAQTPAAKPAETQAAAPKAPTPEQIKALHDALSAYTLDNLQLQQAQNKVGATSPIAKQALQVLNDEIRSSPEVQAAQKKQEDDMKSVKDKIEALRKELHLDASWDWDFNTNQWVRTGPPPPQAAVEAKPVEKPKETKAATPKK